MSIRENELHRSQHARRQHHRKLRRRNNQDIRTQRSKRKQYALDAPLAVLHDDQVLTFFEWCQLNRLSERTGRRILKDPDGPRVTMLSPRRIGVTVRNNRNWQQSRERT
jgi:ATP-dependent helicase YprA (DUF1998 family)